MDGRSIYEYVGGEPAFLRLAHALHERCVADPVLSHPFDRPDLKPDHLERLGRYLAEVFGGPPLYSAQHGGHSAMHEVHAGNDPHDEMYERFVGCFVLALDDAGFPAEADLRAMMRSYVEDAVTEMKVYAPHGSQVPPHLPMPRVARPETS
jgi:hemoglobin